MLIGETERALLLFALLLPAGPGRAADGHAPDRSLAIAIDIHNYAKVEQDTLGGAKQEVAHILRRTGVETLWAATSGEGVLRLPGIDINIIPSSMSNRLTLPPGVSKDALGFTPGLEPDRNWAYILYNRVEAIAMNFFESSYANTAEILGCAIAHEIGHMLLTAPSHSQTGIMRRAWDVWDLRYARRGSLLFTPQQGRRIREEVERRTDALNLR
jgi:hypothetical protein